MPKRLLECIDTVQKLQKEKNKLIEIGMHSIL